MVKDFKKVFGARVKHYRTLIGLTQEKLAEKVGISSHTVSYIERGKNIISFTKLPALCNALDVEPCKLFLDRDIDPDKKRVDEINRLLETANNKQMGIILNLITNVLDV